MEPSSLVQEADLQVGNQPHATWSSHRLGLDMMDGKKGQVHILV